MILGRPWALALLLVPPILLWLRLRAARPRAAEASSLLVWSKVSPEGVPAARPRPPRAAWLEAAGAAVLAIGLADPAVTGAGASSVRVLRDVSPSMPAKAVLGITGPIEETPDPGRVLPGLLASGTPVVVVTDHRLPSFPDDPPRLQVVGVGRPGFNAGFTAASGAPLPDGRWRLFLSIEAHGASGPVEGTLSLGDAKERVTLTPGTPLEVVREAAAPVAEASIDFEGDTLDADDRVALRAAGGERVEARRRGGAGTDALLRALVAAGALRGEDLPAHAEAEEVVLIGGVPARAVHVRIPPRGEGSVPGAFVAATDHPLARGVCVDSASDLGLRAAAPIPDVRIEGDAVLMDDRGVLVEALLDGPIEEMMEQAEVHLRFRPGGTWVERDPSFVVFAKNLVEYAAGGPARLEATGVLDPEETRQAAEGETFGDLRAALEAARRPDPAVRHPLAAILLLAGAGLLAAAWIASR